MIKKMTASLPQLDKGLVAFHSSWNSVDWDYWIRSAESSLDIAVFYWDKWTMANFQAITQFLEKEGTKLRFFITDDENPELLRQIQTLFPDHTKKEIKQKIHKTTEPLVRYLYEQNLSSDKLEIRKVSHLLTYPLQMIDERFVVISLFEIFRDKFADSPAFIIDVSQNPDLKKFFQKEFHCLLHEKDHREINLREI